jgi:hypothetical protein
VIPEKCFFIHIPLRYSLKGISKKKRTKLSKAIFFYDDFKTFYFKIFDNLTLELILPPLSQSQVLLSAKTALSEFVVEPFEMTKKRAKIKFNFLEKDI